jgi:hypothetical protein
LGVADVISSTLLLPRVWGKSGTGRIWAGTCRGEFLVEGMTAAELDEGDDTHVIVPFLPDGDGFVDRPVPEGCTIRK